MNIFPNKDVDGKKFTVQIPKKIIFGEGVAEEVPMLAEESHSDSILFITDSTIKKIGLGDHIITQFQKAGKNVKIFDRVEPEPSIQNAEEVASMARGSHYDLIIGLGGGSVLDMAKMASISANNHEPITDFIGVGNVSNPGIPKILIPTTSGTGSEATKYLILSDTDKGLKTGIETPYNLAEVAVVDPLLTLSVPPQVTAATGLDALTHAVESIMSIDSNPFSESLAIKAVQLIMKSLPKAYREKKNISARRDMSLASLFAGLAISSSGVCAGHAAAYTFAVKHKISHGTGCALVLPYIMEYNAKACLYKLILIAEASGVKKTDEDQEKTAHNAIKAVRDLIKEVKSPNSLRQIGLKEAEIDSMAKNLLRIKRLLAHNPRGLTEKEAKLLFKRMYKGQFLPLSNYNTN